jgi:hypothetical protein
MQPQNARCTGSLPLLELWFVAQPTSGAFQKTKEMALWLSSYAIVEIQLRIFLLLFSGMVSAKSLPTISYKEDRDPGMTFQMFVHLLNSLICSDDRFAEIIEHLVHFAYPVLPAQC